MTVPTLIDLRLDTVREFCINFTEGLRVEIIMEMFDVLV